MDVPEKNVVVDTEVHKALESEEVVQKEGSDFPSGNGHSPIGQEPLPDLLEDKEVKAIIEAMLFVSQESLTIDRLASVIGEPSKTKVGRALRGIQQDYEQQGRGLQVIEVAGGFRMMTRPDYASWVKRLEKVKTAQKLSRSALEALAIIAYKQPVVRGEIEGIRGVETSGVLRTLLERKLVRMVGSKEVPGRPIMYGTTKFFLEHFGLRDLSGLPPLREFKELGELEQTTLPMEADDPEASLENSRSAEDGPPPDSIGLDPEPYAQLECET